MSFYYWRPYVSVAQRRVQAMKKIEKLRKKGINIQPVEIEGRTIAKSYWGKAWCDHLESFSDYENRLPRGRTYVRNGSVCHLEIKTGRIEAMVSGSELYNVSIDINPLKPSLWKTIKASCIGKIGSMLELLKGRLSDHVMSIVTHQQKGLMPLPGEIKLKCSCPDWADMCKHVAAVLYGVGSRLDSMPELLFTLRGVDAAELISTDLAIPLAESDQTDKIIAEDQLSNIFGIEMDKAQPREKSKSEKAPTKRVSRNKLPATVVRVISKTKKIPRKIVRIKVSSRKPVTPALSRSGTASSRTADKLNAPRTHPTGKSVAKLRKKLGLSAPEFAARLGVSTATIYKWERTPGRLNLQRNSLNALALLYQN